MAFVQTELRASPRSTRMANKSVSQLSVEGYFELTGLLKTLQLIGLADVIDS